MSNARVFGFLFFFLTLIHSTTHTESIYHVPGNILATEDTTVNKSNRDTVPMEHM